MIKHVKKETKESNSVMKHYTLYTNYIPVINFNNSWPLLFLVSLVLPPIHFLLPYHGEGNSRHSFSRKYFIILKKSNHNTISTLKKLTIILIVKNVVCIKTSNYFINVM